MQIGNEFRPAPQLLKLYRIYLVFWLVLGVLSWYLPVLILSPALASAIATVPAVAVSIFIAWWIPKYYRSIAYKLTAHEIMWRRGVWFKNTGIVPYNRITNIDVAQGPISRSLGIAALRVQTAGYSGQARAEIRIEGVEKYEELRETIMGFVKGRKPVAIGAGGAEDKDIETKILDELVKIRKLLEKS
jgi:hypothetical protein